MSRIRIGGMLLALSVAVVRAEDWTTVDGNTYKNVRVLAHDDGYVTILDDEGGGKIMLSELPSAIRARFGFDPAKACACVAATEKAEAADSEALSKETERADAAIRTNEQREAAQQAPSPPSAPQQTSNEIATTPTLTADQRQQIQDQIQSLQEDIAMMQGELNRTNDKTDAGGSYVSGSAGGNYSVHVISHGAYADKIAAETEQIRALQAELNGNGGPVATAPQHTIESEPLSSFSSVPHL
jgi:hypothetical protein